MARIKETPKPETQPATAPVDPAAVLARRKQEREAEAWQAARELIQKTQMSEGDVIECADALEGAGLSPDWLQVFRVAIALHGTKTATRDATIKEAGQTIVARPGPPGASREGCVYAATGGRAAPDRRIATGVASDWVARHYREPRAYPAGRRPCRRIGRGKYRRDIGANVPPLVRFGHRSGRVRIAEPGRPTARAGLCRA